MLQTFLLLCHVWFFIFHFFFPFFAILLALFAMHLISWGLKNWSISTFEVLNWSTCGMSFTVQRDKTSCHYNASIREIFSIWECPILWYWFTFSNFTIFCSRTLLQKRQFFHSHRAQVLMIIKPFFIIVGICCYCCWWCCWLVLWCYWCCCC